MVDERNQKNACVYEGKEYILTGRSASRAKSTVIELRPKFNGGFGDNLNIWVSPADVYKIDED